MKKSLHVLEQVLSQPQLSEALNVIDESDRHDVLQYFLDQERPFLEQKPKFIHMAGIPGSGKSTQAEKLSQQLEHCAIVLIAFDAVMERLPGYQAMTCPKQAFAAWELPARALGYLLIKTCLEQQRSILLDHSGADPSHLDLLKALRDEQEYEIDMYYLEALPEKVLPLIEQREQQIQRHTPPRLVYDRYKILGQMIPQYRDIVDNFNVCRW